MTDRAAFTAGLRKLADLLNTDPTLPLPWEGTQAEISLFFPRYPATEPDEQIRQALPVIAAMTNPVAVIEDDRRYKHGALWLKVRGDVEGVKVKLAFRGDEVCEARPKAKRAADRWVIPAVLVDAIAARSRPLALVPALAERPGGDNRG